MADTFSSLLRLRLQQTGGNNNTWGALLNSAVAQLLEDAIAGKADITVASNDVTLSANNGANDQARMAVLNLGGSPGAPRNIIVPALSKPYIVINSTGQTMTVKTAAGSGVAVPNGACQYVYCNGTNVVAVEASAVGGEVALATNALKLGGIDAEHYARKDAFNQHTKGFATTFVQLTDGATVTADCTGSNAFYVTLGGNRTLVLSDPADGQTIQLWVIQDATGGRTLSFPSNVFVLEGARLSGLPNAVDQFTLTYHQGKNFWIGTRALNAFSNATALTFSHNENNVQLFERAGRPGGATTINVLVDTGVLLSSISARSPAMDMSGFASGTIINLFNRGLICGRGGDGGQGGSAVKNITDNQSNDGAMDGRAGGDAIRGAAGITVNIYNAEGFIWGGGGGGGGGAAQAIAGSQIANGGGGGGGAGGGTGADGGRTGTLDADDGLPGADGTIGYAGAAGAGGAGKAAFGGTAGNGGAGGDFGAAGSAGGNAGGIVGGAGGAAGRAVNLNGGTFNFVSGSGSPNVKGAVS